jgi:hypothetical protein
LKDWQSRYAKCPSRMVQVVWWDSSQSANETMVGPPSISYNAGAISELIGFLVGETDEWYYIADSYEADAAVAPSHRRHRSIRNIQKTAVCQITDLLPRGLHVAPEHPATPAPPRGDRFREAVVDGTSAPSAEDRGKGSLVGSRGAKEGD